MPGVLYSNAGNSIIIPTTTLTNYTVNGKTFSVVLNGDGSVNVGGVTGTSGAGAVGTQIAIFTADGYNSAEYQYVSGDTIKFGGFGAAIQSTDPVKFDIPVSIVDGDGDTVAVRRSR